jgi:hypothetical protein
MLPDPFEFQNQQRAISGPAARTLWTGRHDRRVFLEAIVYIRKSLKPQEMLTIFRSSASSSSRDALVQLSPCGPSASMMPW